MNGIFELAGRVPRTVWTSVIVASGFAIAQYPPLAVTMVLVLVALGAAVLGGPAASVPAVFVALPFWMFDLQIRASVFSPLELALLLTGTAAAVWFAVDLVRTRRIDVIWRWLPDWGVIILAASLAILACLSLLWVADPDLRPDSVRALRRVILEPMLIIPGLVWMARAGSVRRALPWLALPAVGISVLAIGQMVLDRSTVEIGGIGRPIGTFTHPNNLAFYLERVVWFVPIALLPLAGRRYRVVWALAAVVLLACLATLSRGAAIGLTVGACVYFADELRRNWRRIALIAIPLAAAAFLARYLASSSSSVDSRESIWRSAIDMLRDHPWTGVGLDQFLGQYGRRYVRIEGWPERYTSHPHNIVLDFWLSLGVAGVIWLWILLEQVWSRFRKLAGTQRDTVQRAAVAMLVTGLVHGLLDNSFFLPDLATWTWIGLVLATPIVAGRAMNNLALSIVDATPLWTTLLGLSVGIAIAWWAVQGVDWAPILVIASIPIQRTLLIGSSDRHVTFTQVWLAAFIAGALLCFARGGIRLRVDLVSAVFGALVGVIAMSIVANPPVGSWAGEVYRWTTPMLFFVFARSYLGLASIRRLGMALATVSAVCCVWAIWQIVDASGPTSFERNGLMRVAGGFGEPNPFAAYLVFSSLALAGIAWNERTTVYGWIFAAGAALGLATAVLTQSRGGLLGLAGGVAVFAIATIVLIPRPWRAPIVVAAAVVSALLIVGFVVLSPWDVRSQAVSSANWAERERQAHWTAAWGMIQDHPWFGVGAGAFDDRFREYTTDWRFRIPRGHAHNAYLQMAATAGIGAVMVYLALLTVLGRRLIQRTGEGAWSGIAIGALAATAGLALHGVFDYLHVLSLGLLFAGIWACALGVRNKDHQLRERDSSL